MAEYTCECGAPVLNDNRSTHEKSHKHDVQIMFAKLFGAPENPTIHYFYVVPYVMYTREAQKDGLNQFYSVSAILKEAKENRGVSYRTRDYPCRTEQRVRMVQVLMKGERDQIRWVNARIEELMGEAQLEVATNKKAVLGKAARIWVSQPMSNYFRDVLEGKSSGPRRDKGEGKPEDSYFDSVRLLSTDTLVCFTEEANNHCRLVLQSNKNRDIELLLTEIYNFWAFHISPKESGKGKTRQMDDIGDATFESIGVDILDEKPYTDPTEGQLKSMLQGL